ncbi:UDP-N-acetylmuramate dehydrogenase [Thiobacillus denitrificans]|uniref:UDP-N-acetylenolpyruvoylglucosamine reductase n=1 Tax=Thiobacillus denitrificans TaxID=36861 RepID=A0A106BPF5_THIDE|nr:UDP-N-acetylmuramate dehydrogenase [Thiobacillus denitrificans]KVW96240.1 UDP-N-acetylenolpyruvoylglucosamine reductase [Thiobacillus denitrificans]
MRHDYRMSEIDVAGGGAPVLRGRFFYNEPMKKHVSWRAGGAAQRVYIPADLEDLGWLVRSVPAHEDIHMVGLGSNLLVRDGGVAGVVILLHGVLKKLAIESRTHGLPPAPADIDTALVYAQAGVAAPKLARFSANHNLVGGEFWAGIPGTVGGVIAMNAGCFDSETWDKLVQVQTLDRQGQLNERLPDEYVTGYRHVALRHAREEWFIGGWFRLARGDGAASRETIRELLKKRIATQPLNLPNAGSVFRNPPGDYAARLIESCGLKGYRVGDAQVSEKHANFIVNRGHATATDIERLIEHIEDSVEAHTNVRLLREVRIIGERR